MAVKKPGISSDNPNRRAGRYDAVGDNDVGHRYTETDNSNANRYVSEALPLLSDIGTLTVAETTFHSVGVTWDIPTDFDTDHNGVVAVEYRKTGAGSWSNGANLIRTSDYAYDWPTGDPVEGLPAQNHFAGSLMFLTPGTSYDVRLTYTDLDDVEVGRSESFTVSTRAIPVKPTGGTTYYCDPGAGGGGDGSTGTPWQEIDDAQGTVVAGDIVLLRSGTYAKATLSASGAEDNHIVYAEDPTDPGAVLDEIDIGGQSHIWIDVLGFEFNDTDAKLQTFVDGDVATGTDRITLTSHGYSNADQISFKSTGTLPTGLNEGWLYYAKDIDANTIEVYEEVGLTTLVDITAATGGGTHTISTHVVDQSWAVTSAIYVGADGGNEDDIIITNCTFTGYQNAVLSFYALSRWVCLDNTVVGFWPAGIGIPSAGLPTVTVSTGKGISTGGEGLVGGPGCVTAFNSITRVTDGCNVGTGCDLYSNQIWDCAGNGHSVDNAYANVRLWGNRITQCQGAPISLQPQRSGPWYYLYNQYADIVRGVFKFRYQDRVVFINNTFIANPSSSLTNNGQFFLKFYMRNNLFIADQDPILSTSVSSSQPSSNYADWKTDIDYDGWDKGNNTPNYFFHWFGNTVLYSTIASWTTAVTTSGTTGISCEENGIEVDADVIFDDYTISPTNSLVLAAGANDAVDAGILVDNLADWHGATPDLGAHQRGATALPYGPRGSGTPLDQQDNFWNKH